jgi:endo-1,4-beta-D-glucanase Y
VRRAWGILNSRGSKEKIMNRIQLFRSVRSGRPAGVLAAALAATLAAPFACSSDNGNGTTTVPEGRGGSGGNASGGQGGPNGSGGTGGASGGSGGSSGSAGGSSGNGGQAGTGGAGGGNDGPLETHAAAYPFGSHKFKYPAGMIAPSGGQAMVDGQVKTYYDKWKAKYLQQKCGGYVVNTAGPSGGGTGVFPETFTVSEGHGYGMVIAVMMAGHDPKAQEQFDGLFKVFKAFPSEANPNLMAWEIENACPKKYPTVMGMTPPGVPSCTESAPGCFRINGMAGWESSATDGDLDVAFSLVIADKQWGSGGAINYRAEAKKVIAAIKMSEMNQMSTLPLVADTIKMGTSDYWATRPSDFMIDHFRAFAAVTGDDFWNQSVDNIHKLLLKMQADFAPQTGLLPDFIVGTDTMPKPAPPFQPQADEGPTTGEYAYNSCRVPWHLGVDYIVSGDSRAKDELGKLNKFVQAVTDGFAERIVDGYKLDGSLGSLPPDQADHGSDPSFTAPFGVAATIDAGNQAWLDKVWTVTNQSPLDTYYGDTIRMLTMVAISGNWWKP